MPEAMRKEIWDDGTHFTPKGYDLVGSIIADRIAEIVSSRELLKSPGSSELKAELRKRLSRE